MMMERPQASRGMGAMDRGVEFDEMGDPEEDDYIDWADGDVGSAGGGDDEHDSSKAQWNGEITIEGSPSDAKPATRQQRKRKITAKDREFAEMVHKSHLLCLIARGRLLESACNDPLLQASVLSVAPKWLNDAAQSGASKRRILGDLVTWVKTSFRVSGGGGSSSSQGGEIRDISGQLQQSIQKQNGSAEEITAVAVALLRALGFTTRYVVALNASSLKPDEESLDASQGWRPDSNEQTFNFSAVDDMESKRVASLAHILASTVPLIGSSTGPRAQNKPNHEVSPTSTRNAAAAAVSPKGRGRGGRTGRGGRGGRGRGGRGGRGGRANGKLDGNSSLGPRTERDAECDTAAPSSSSQGGAEIENGRGSSSSGQQTADDIQSERELALAISLSAAESERKDPERKRDPNDEFERELAMALAASAVSAAASESEGRGAGQTRKGDEEYERELAVAMAATADSAPKAVEGRQEAAQSTSSPPSMTAFHSNKMKLLAASNGNAKSADRKGREYGGAAWSRKFGPVMHWAEVYFDREAHDGRWMHVDAARGVVDGADKVEAAAAGHLPLRYVVAFAGGGAKDVTRRYVKLWSTVSPLRVDVAWWEETLAPLKELEAAATAGPPSSMIQGESSTPPPAQLNDGGSASSDIATSFVTPDLSNIHEDGPVASPKVDFAAATSNAAYARHGKSPAPQTRGSLSASRQSDRGALEDMEMETKAFTEPLPTNQQAYKSHHLYVLERWLTKYETLHPKGPVLGFCGGQSVYPRTCVQVLHTPDRWLREGCKVKPGESAAKVVRASRFVAKMPSETLASELDGRGDEPPAVTMTELFGKWQTEPWQPPRAVDGRVPKDERGQVDARSKHCIPPGTVHLSFPRLVPIAQKLGINFAPAMVGFEVRKGRSFPVYEGIVVCEEFKDVIMDAFSQEEDIRLRVLIKKRTALAGQKWVSLIRSMSTRQRLQDTYENVASPKGSKKRGSGVTTPTVATRSGLDATAEKPTEASSPQKKRSTRGGQILDSEHVHSFPEENQSFDEDTGIRTKKCDCGFTYYVEDL